MSQYGQDQEVVEVTRPRTDSPTLLRKNLKQHLIIATRQDNKEKLKTALRNYEDLSERATDSKVAREARNKIFVLDMKESLKDAIKRKDVDQLKALLKEIKEKSKDCEPPKNASDNDSVKKQNGITRSLTFEIQEARKVIMGRDAAAKRYSAISKQNSLVLDKKAMSDVTSYRRPPPGVHSVLQATLLLFGEDEDLTSDWAKCKALVNPSAQNGLLKRLPGADLSESNPELVARAQQILDAVEFDDIVRSSISAACFYNYTSAVIDKCVTEGKLNGVTPADIERQRVILNRPLSPRTERYNRMKGTSTPDEPPIVEVKVL